MGSAYIDGFYSALDRDLRRSLGRRVPQRPSRAFCGRLAVCRRTLRRTLNAALVALQGEHGPAMRDWPAREGRDRIEFTSVSTIPVEPIHWQNRPTFQQVMSFTGHRPRR